MKARTDRYLDLFPAAITSRDLEGDFPVYGWSELLPADAGAYSVQLGSRGGTTTTNHARELNDRIIPVGERVWMRLRDEDDGQTHYEFEQADVNTHEGDVINYYEVVVNYFDSTINYNNTVINFTDVTFNFLTETIFVVNVNITFEGDGYVIYDLPLKIFDGLWLHYNTIELLDDVYNNLSLRVPADAGKDRVVVRFLPDVLDSVVEIKGMKAVPDLGSGQVVWLLNISETNTIELVHDGVGTADQIYTPETRTYALGPHSGVPCWYDPTSQAWRLLGRRDFDEKVKVTEDDTTPGYLFGTKLTPGEGIDFDVLDEGGDESLQIHATAQDIKFKITEDDSTTDYGGAKIISSDNSVTITILDTGGYQQLDLSVPTTGGGPTATNGSDVLAAPFAITAGYADTGLSVSLPAAGTYLLLATLYSSMEGSKHDYVGYRLFDVTAGAPVGCPGIHELQETPNAVAVALPIHLHHLLVAASARTVRVEASLVSGTSNANLMALSELSYVRVA